uniref:Tau-tubulin kinase 1 n=1 Tax=Ascaris suum TaxID=6253 RepID=F1L531_ASCSU
MHTSSSSSSSIPKPSFDPGDIVNGTWKVRRELGCGGCGIVYEVELIRGARAGLRAAMKAETIDASHKYSETLSAEALVLRRMQRSPHFCRLYLAGKCSPDCNVIVMSLVGRTLSWLRRQNPSQRFTLSTSLRLALQCIEAVEHLHSMGIIHRDVKGSNFAIGQQNLRRVVHMIDFGFARLYLKKEATTGELDHRPPRKRAPYLGTDRYCSIHVHKREEQGRRDDLWSFLYMIVEFVVGELPWRSSSYRKLLAKKSRGGEHLLKDCPIEFYKIYDHIRRLGYMDRPNYQLIRRTINEICKRRNFSIEDPFDWEEGGRYHKEYLRTIEQLEKENQRNLGKGTEATTLKQEELETVYSSADLSCEHSDAPTARDSVSGRSKERRASKDLSSIYRLLHRYPYIPASNSALSEWSDDGTHFDEETASFADTDSETNLLSIALTDLSNVASFSAEMLAPRVRESRGQRK